MSPHLNQHCIRLNYFEAEYFVKIIFDMKSVCFKNVTTKISENTEN